MNHVFSKISFPNKDQGFIRIIIVLILVGIILFVGGLYFYFQKQTIGVFEILTEQLPVEEEITQNKVWYIIDTGLKDIRKYRMEISADSTVFSLLEELAVRENFEIETTFYPEMGIFVESINDFKSGSDNKWWQYYINGKLGETAADRKKAKSDDIIEWKFEVPSESW